MIASERKFQRRRPPAQKGATLHLPLRVDKLAAPADR